MKIARTTSLIALAVLAACGGGDPPQTGWVGASKICDGPFDGDVVAKCDLAVDRSAPATIVLRAEALMRAHNGTRDPVRFQRFSMVRLGGDAYGYVTDEFVLQPGDSRSEWISVSAVLPTANAGALPALANFSSYDRSEVGTTISEIRISVGSEAK